MLINVGCIETLVFAYIFKNFSCFSQIKPTESSLFVYFVFFFNAFVSLDTTDEILISSIIIIIVCD